MKHQTIITHLLLAFVMLSIGFAIGMEVTRWRLDNQTQVSTPQKDRIVVYYTHRSNRCKTCNLVESMGQEVVNTDFAEAVKAGELEWQDVNYETDSKFAKAHDIAGNMILVAKFKDGQIVKSCRLNNVMQLAGKREEFLEYVRSGIAEVLEDEG